MNRSSGAIRADDAFAADANVDEAPRGSQADGRVTGRLLPQSPAHVYPNAAAICARFLADARQSKPPGYLHATKPSCREVKLPVPFEATGPFRAAHAISFDSGTQDWTELAVRVDGGVLRSHVLWDYFNPDASQFDQHAAVLEAIRVEGDTLIATVGREEGWISPAFEPKPDRDANDESMELRLVRGVITCALTRLSQLTCRGFFPTAKNPLLGAKRRPWPRTYPRETQWSSAAWDRVMPIFTIADDQLIVRVP